MVDREVPERFDKVRFAGAAGPAQAQVLGSAEPFEGPERVLGGSGDRGGGLVPDVEGLAGRQPRRAAAHPDRGLVAPGRFLDQQQPDDFGRVPALRAGGREDLGRRFAQVGQPQAAGEPVELVWQRRRRRGGERHAPKPSQARVERCNEDASRAGNAITCADRVWWWARIAASAPSSKRPASAAIRNDPSTGSRPWSLARSTASAILRRTRPAPAAAARVSHALAPGPIAKNAASPRFAVSRDRRRGRGGLKRPPEQGELWLS